MPTVTFKKTLLNLDKEDFEKFTAVYGRTIGVSKAVRALMAKHLKLLALKKEEKDQLNERTTPTDLS